MSATTFSVVIPCLDEARILGRGLARLRRLMPDVQLVVADGGSGDGSAAVARRFAEVVTAAASRGHQLNRGAELAVGDVLVFLHADARLRRDPRPELGQVLRRQGCAAAFFDQRIGASGWAYRLIERAAKTRARRFGWILGDLGLAVSRRVFVDVGGFPDEPLFEDLSISRRLRRVGRFDLCPVPLLVSPRRWQRGGVVRTSLLNWSLTIGYHLGVPPRRLARAYRATR